MKRIRQQQCEDNARMVIDSHLRGKLSFTKMIDRLKELQEFHRVRIYIAFTSTGLNICCGGAGELIDEIRQTIDTPVFNN